MIFYFSGTGNSQWAAEELAANLQDKAVMMTEAPRCYSLGKGEIIGFVFPIYAWAAPAYIYEFIKNLQLENYQQNYIFFVATCHTQTGNIDGSMKAALKARGWDCNAGFSINMPNNYLMAPFVKTDSLQKRKKLLAAAQKKIAAITGDIKAGYNGFKLTRGFKLFSLMTPLFRKFMTAKGFWVEQDICIKCGKCTEVCPVGNIKLNPYPVWDNKCQMCVACLNKCPVAAIQYGRFTKGKERYVFCKDYLPKV